MEPSNLSINSTQQSASQFFQGSVASLKSWGSRVCQQLHHHREILHTYSPKTKIGLLIAVNTLFFVGVRILVNFLEERGNRTNPEKTGLHATISPVVFGVAIAGLNVGLSKVGRYQLPALTLYAITISSVAVYLILKRPQSLLAPIRKELLSESEQISRLLETLNRKQTELEQRASLITQRLTPSPQTSTSTPALPQTPPPASIPTLPEPVTPALPQSPSPEDQVEFERIQAKLTQNEQTRLSLTTLAGTIEQEVEVVSNVEKKAPHILANQRTPGRVDELGRYIRARYERTLSQSSLVPSPSRPNLPQSAPPSTPTRSNSSPQVSGTPGTVTPPSSPGTQVQTSSSSTPGDATLHTSPASPAILSSTPPETNPTETVETNPPEDHTEGESNGTDSSDSTLPVGEILQTEQSFTSYLVTGLINNFTPTLSDAASNVAINVFSNAASTAYNFLTR